MAGITINPVAVTSAKGLFYVSSEGYVAGTALDDPAIRNELVSGIVSPSASAPMWGGLAITDSLTTPAIEASNIGSVLTLATNLATITGFTVFNQATAMIQTPQSTVPLAAASMAINFYRLGSGAKIALPISAANAATLQGSASNTAVYWDYTNQVVLLTGTGVLPVKVTDVNIGNSMIVTYNSGTGNASWTYTGSTVIVQI